MVEFKNTGVTFKQKRNIIKAVSGASFTIEKGDIFGIVGGSGAGKSTLLRTINLLQPVTTGDVLVKGKSVVNLKGKALRNLRQNIGMIFQHFNLAENKTVSQNIAFVLETAGHKRSEIKSRIKELLEFVNLSDKANAYPSKLSGGQKQRVAIARALANNTEILLCDEPTSALDVETTASVLALLKEINQRLGITVIIITHELEVVKAICNRVAVMSEAEIVEIGNVYEVFTNPQHQFTKQLISHTQRFDVPQEILNKLSGPLVKIIYKGEKAAEAILSDTAEKFGVRYNILHGKIEYIGTNPTGILYVNIIGTQENILLAIKELEEKTQKAEVILSA
ncbi:MAG: methionine ABC transporter ATP-binding protein [Clostridiales bacterium]|nr:methionine ABC transporter ATP-binding protein [Clostridiales bacterium]